MRLLKGMIRTSAFLMNLTAIYYFTFLLRMEDLIQKMRDADIKGQTDLTNHQKNYLEKLDGKALQFRSHLVALYLKTSIRSFARTLEKCSGVRDTEAKPSIRTATAASSTTAPDAKSSSLPTPALILTWPRPLIKRTSIICISESIFLINLRKNGVHLMRYLGQREAEPIINSKIGSKWPQQSNRKGNSMEPKRTVITRLLTSSLESTSSHVAIVAVSIYY